MKKSQLGIFHQRYYYQFFCKVKILCVVVLALLNFSVVSCDDSGSSENQSYDPDLASEIQSFMPDSGGIRTKFIVRGFNFGDDASEISVLFSEDKEQAKVIGVNNETIYCLVPKQSGGDNSVWVVSHGDTLSFDATFRYNVSQKVSTIVGVSGNAGSDDGTLSEGRVQRTFGMAPVYGGDLLTFETWSGNVRFIALADNSITTIQTGYRAGQPAISKDRKKVYNIAIDGGAHKVVLYDYDVLWQPQTIVSGIEGVTGTIFSCALDDTEEWLYFRDRSGTFGRLEIAHPSNVEILGTEVGPVEPNDYQYIAYSPFDDCFFLSSQSRDGIYKISKDAQTVEPYIGFNGQVAADGPRLSCAVVNPCGLTFDSKGNMYWCDSSGPTIRKLDHKSDLVSTIAGVVGKFAGDDGDPMEATFSYPYCIAADEEDNFFIGESWGSTIRELAIQ